MIVDKKGRLFGKINIIDFLVILILIAAIAVVGVKFLGKDGGTADDTIVMCFYIEEVDDWVADKVQIGDALYDGTYEMELGVVTATERDTPRTWGLTAEGQYVPATRDGFCSMIITGEVQGKKTVNGATINGKKYGVGHTMILHAGDAKMYLRVYDISVKE